MATRLPYLTLAALSALGLGFSSAKSSEQKTFETELAELAEASHKIRGNCEEFTDQVEAVLQGSDPDQPLPGRKRTQELLQVIRSYPGTPDATRLAALKISQTKAPDWDFTLIYKAYPCNSVAYFKGATQLITSIKKAKLSPALRKQAKETLLRAIHEEVKGPTTLFNALIQIDLVDQMMEAKVIQVSPTTRSELRALEAEARKLQAEISKAPGPHPSNPKKSFDELSSSEKKQVTRLIRTEVEAAQNLSQRLRKILDQISAYLPTDQSVPFAQWVPKAEFFPSAP